MHISLNLWAEYLHVFHFTTSRKMMSSVNKYKISLEPAKHIIEKVRKLLHQAAGARESNIENRTRRSKIKSSEIIVSRNIQPLTVASFWTTKITNQISIAIFCTTKKQPIKSQLQVFARISSVQLRINHISRNQSNLSNFVQHVIRA